MVRTCAYCRSSRSTGEDMCAERAWAGSTNYPLAAVPRSCLELPDAAGAAHWAEYY